MMTPVLVAFFLLLLATSAGFPAFSRSCASPSSSSRILRRGRIVSVHDSTKEWMTNNQTYTPHTLQLPMGSYTVALLGPDSTRQSVVVGLNSTGRPSGASTSTRKVLHADRSGIGRWLGVFLG